MVQAIVNINEKTNWLLNLIKAKYGLKTKSESIERMAEDYESSLLEPSLRPEYVRKLKKAGNQKPIYIGSVEDFKRRYG